jgi:hypothetical protein
MHICMHGLMECAQHAQAVASKGCTRREHTDQQAEQKKVHVVMHRAQDMCGDEESHSCHHDLVHMRRAAVCCCVLWCLTVATAYVCCRSTCCCGLPSAGLCHEHMYSEQRCPPDKVVHAQVTREATVPAPHTECCHQHRGGVAGEQVIRQHLHGQRQRGWRAHISTVPLYGFLSRTHHDAYGVFHKAASSCNTNHPQAAYDASWLWSKPGECL